MSWHTVTHQLFNEVAIAQDGTAIGEWVAVKGAEGFNFWDYLTSTGAPSVAISVDVSLFQPGATAADGTQLHDRDSSTRNNFRTIEVVAATTTKDEWVHHDTPDELQYPICWMRGRAVEGDVAAVDSLSVVVAVNGQRP